MRLVKSMAGLRCGKAVPARCVLKPRRNASGRGLALESSRGGGGEMKAAYGVSSR